MSKVLPNTAASVRDEWDKARADDGSVDKTELVRMLRAIAEGGVSDDELAEASKIRKQFLEQADWDQLVAAAMHDEPSAEVHQQVAKYSRSTADMADQLYWAVARQRFEPGFLDALAADLVASMNNKKTDEK